jgi:peptidoglycan DL-endopeptidase CwlO
MKQRSTTPVSTSFAAKATIVAAAVLMLVATPVQLVPKAKADVYDEQIAAIQKEIDQYQAVARELQGKADTLQRELDRLSNEKAQLQAQIDLNQKKHDQLVSDIADTIKKIEENRRVSGELIINDSLSAKVSPFVRIAGSDNLAKSIDEAANAESAQQDIIDKIKEIERLQKKLEEDKKKVEQVLQDQNNQREALAAKEAEQAQLVAQTRGEEAAYQNLSAQKNNDISSLRAQQAEANRKAMQSIGYGIPAGVPGGGGYPGQWANAPLDAYIDPWGLYTRECVSYAAWKVHSTGRFVPHFGGRGNANQWPSTVAEYGISSGSTPKAGSVAMWPIGYYGHVMYVESVNGDGTITVSDYNLEWDGNYRLYKRSASGLTYIYF